MGEGPRTEAWNDAKSKRHFRHDGRSAIIGHHRSGALEFGSLCMPCLLEYDRGTLDGGHVGGKLEG